MHLLVWLLITCSLASITSANLARKKLLQACWNQQVKPVQKHFLRFAYQEQRYELEHSAQPWQQTPYQAKGTIWVNPKNFYQNDTLSSPTRNRTYFAKTQASDQTLLLLKHGEDKLAAITPEMVAEQLLQTARYSPITLIDYFHRQQIPLDLANSTAQYGCYTATINQTRVRLFIRRDDGLLNHLSLLSADELLGDVLSTITYYDYVRQDASQQPTRIQIDKINGRLHDQIKLSQLVVVAEAPHLLDTPLDYQQQAAKPIVPTAQLESYNEYIHFINLPHTDDKVMLVEFADFLLVAEAPLNSQNGELIIQEARRLAPTKPIRYFVFGHHHPHYLGGIRPFVQKGATVLCCSDNEEYVRYLVDAAHRLQPDSLALAPRPLKLEAIGTHKTITDGGRRMEIYMIGKQSAHTNDYLIYYFPAEGLLFQDDLVWIAKTGSPKKASARQVGLYRAIKDLGLPVRTIVQSWPVSEMGVKTVIPFAELEASVEEK